jgi:peptidoglycan hydrolase-like protein with peptidoglycan-binding domain
MTLDIFPRVPDDYSVSLGDDFFLVSIIQFLLNELTIAYDSFIPLLISGVYDEATAKNIREFQQKNALEESGNVNKETWNRLVEAYSASASNYVY